MKFVSGLVVGFALAFVLIAYLVVDSFFPMEKRKDAPRGGLRRC